VHEAALGAPRDLPRVVSAWLAPDGFSPLRARRAVRRLAGLEDPALHSVLLLVDELVTRIVRQGASDADDLIGLRIAQEGDRVRVELTPPASHADGDAEDGATDEALLRGALLRSLAARSGSTSRGGDRRLWFELDAA
jgi:hypothetical protein